MDNARGPVHILDGDGTAHPEERDNTQYRDDFPDHQRHDEEHEWHTDVVGAIELRVRQGLRKASVEIHKQLYNTTYKYT